MEYKKRSSLHMPMAHGQSPSQQVHGCTAKASIGFRIDFMRIPNRVRHLEYFERPFDNFTTDISRDEHYARSLVSIRPNLELDKIVDHGLHSMNNEGPPANVDDAFDAK
jgi:hypothetical protein